MLTDLTTPGPGPVDPERCIMCERLRDVLQAVVLLGDPQAAGNLVRAAHAHMIYGHPNDRRTQRAVPVQTSRTAAYR